jgi:hypothetical protein
MAGLRQAFLLQPLALQLLTPEATDPPFLRFGFSGVFKHSIMFTPRHEPPAVLPLSYPNAQTPSPAVSH